MVRGISPTRVVGCMVSLICPTISARTERLSVMAPPQHPAGEGRGSGQTAESRFPALTGAGICRPYCCRIPNPRAVQFPLITRNVALNGEHETAETAHSGLVSGRLLLRGPLTELEMVTTSEKLARM